MPEEMRDTHSISLLVDLSRSISLQAHWFLHSHGRAYALFYAIGRPKLFNRPLFQVRRTPRCLSGQTCLTEPPSDLQKLLELGAVFSLQLVQQLYNVRALLAVTVQNWI
jgi:hypothetical protein